MIVNGYTIKNFADLRNTDLRGADLSYANLTNATIPIANFDTISRYSYPLHVKYTSEGLLFIAGCRMFTLAEAKKHWLSSKYPDKKRGQMFYDYCKLIHEHYHLDMLHVKPKDWLTPI